MIDKQVTPQKMTIDFDIANLSENDLYQYSPEILEVLLKDRTASYYSKKKKNIIWANDNYIGLGKKYGATCPITPDLITGNQGNLIIPRALKSKAKQKERTKSKAEVFTPSWIVKKQNDALDENFKDDDLKTYIGRAWLEITCGEAPYLANRYEMATGELIELNERTGFLDRKLRRINQEIDNPKQWQYWAKKAYQASYGFEWNGDSLLLARENLLLTYYDFYVDKWRSKPSIDELLQVAQIISYNIFQMDGLTCTIPLSQKRQLVSYPQDDLFDTAKPQEIMVHQGRLVKIKDWQTGKLVNFMEITP